MSIFSYSATGETHKAWRVAYTHITGEKHEATFCSRRIGREGIEGYFRRQPGVLKINGTAKAHYHDSQCQDQGVIPEGTMFGDTSMKITWSR